MDKTTYKPSFAVPPIETIKEASVDSVFGQGMLEEFEKGITPRHAMMLEAMFKVDRSFWLNLQKNYDQDLERLALEEFEPIKE